MIIEINILSFLKKMIFSQKLYSILIGKIKTFDYFRLGNSFLLYFVFIFFSIPFIYLIGVHATYIDSIITRSTFHPRVFIFLILGLLSFVVAMFGIKFRTPWFSRLGLDKEWKEKNVPWAFIVLLLVTLVGKMMMFLNGQYLISSRIFHLQSLFGDINNPASFAYLIGYFEILSPILVALSFVRYFHLLRENIPSWKIWRNISWLVLFMEALSGFLTGNRLPIITVIITYAVVRHYAYQKSWKHFFTVIVFCLVVVMPLGSFYEKPEDILNAMKTSAPNQIILDTTVGRFSQNFVISSIIEKTETFSYGKNLLNFFVSLGPPRFIWKDKPIISFEGNKFGREYGIINDFDFNTNVGPTMVGDLYMNFGLWGIIGGLFILGFIYKFIFDLFISFPKKALSGVMIYAVLWPGLIKGMENDAASVLAGAVKLAIFVYLIHLCLTTDWRRFVIRIANFRHFINN